MKIKEWVKCEITAQLEPMKPLGWEWTRIHEEGLLAYFKPKGRVLPPGWLRGSLTPNISPQQQQHCCPDLEELGSIDTPPDDGNRSSGLFSAGIKGSTLPACLETAVLWIQDVTASLNKCQMRIVLFWFIPQLHLTTAAKPDWASATMHPGIRRWREAVKSWVKSPQSWSQMPVRSLLGGFCPRWTSMWRGECEQ